MFFVFEIVTFWRENDVAILAQKNYIIDTGGLLCLSERAYCKNLKSEVHFKL